jgi:hypothetical protein
MFFLLCSVFGTAFALHIRPAKAENWFVCKPFPVLQQKVDTTGQL